MCRTSGTRVRALIWTLWGLAALFVVYLVWVVVSIRRSLRNDPGGLRIRREVLEKLGREIREGQRRTRDFF